MATPVWIEVIRTTIRHREGTGLRYRDGVEKACLVAIKSCKGVLSEQIDALEKIILKYEISCNPEADPLSQIRFHMCRVGEELIYLAEGDPCDPWDFF